MAESKQQQQLKEITEKLEQGVKELFTSEKYMEYLRVMSQFHNYSFSNTLLIAMQKPEATLVAGYGAWQKKFERNVMKGEKAIKIFAPAPRKVEVERDMLDPETQRPVIDENGEVKKEKVTVQQPYFKITSVFDVSQTDGKPLPELDTVQDLTGSVEGYNIFFEALKRTSKVPMEFQPIEGGSHGFYHQIDKRIAIAEGMSEAQNVKTGIHEIAHSRMHDRDMIDAENGILVDRRTREVQAESVAYTVCQHYGIETSDYSFGYIAGWSEGKEMKELRSSMEVIRREADSMIKEIDGHLADIRREREQETELTAEAEKSFIAKYYVVEDLQVRGSLQIEKYDDLETALTAYFALPNDKVRALGIENSKPRTGSLDFIHCHDGVDEIVQDYQKVEGWMNPEIVAVVDRIQTALEEREAAEQSYVNPMYQNYLDIKAENADRIVLYQVGDFFEAFNADAETLAKDLDLMLTSRPISDTERVPLVGLPKHNLENYVEKLQAQGHKITIAALDEGERKIYQMASPQSEEPVIPLTSENTEPSKALNGYSRKDVEEMVLFATQAELEEMELSESVKLLGARVYGSRTRDGLFEESSDIDVVLSLDAPNGVLYEDTFFNAIITMQTDHISVRQHFGTWYPIDQAEIDGKMYFLLEHEEYGDEAANIIVDEKGILYAQDVYNGFSPEIMDTLHLIATPIGVMPDPSVSVEDMEKYGYTYLGMVPMDAEAASEHFKQGGMMVYALHPDGTESVIENAKQFDRHVENGGLFAVDKEDWMKYLENGEFLRTTEVSTEQNYNMIDGRRNNMEPHKKEKPNKEKESLLGRLKEKQQFLIANARKEDKEKRAERDLP